MCIRSKALLVCSTALALGGCAAAPKIGYEIVTVPGDLTEEQLATYALQENVVIITATTSGEKDKAKTSVTATLDRQDFEGVRMALLRRGGLGVETDIAIKRFDNTDIPSEITVKVNDTRADLVKKVGEVALAVLKSGIVPFSGTGDAVLPARINLSAELGTPDPNRVTKVLDSNVSVEFGPVPPDAVPRAEHRFPEASSYFYYAACRRADLKFKYKGEPYFYSFKVADPNFLQRQRMPIDGKITMHSQCGVSVTGKLAGDDAASTLAITTALIEQVAALRAALKEEDETEDGE